MVKAALEGYVMGKSKELTDEEFLEQQAEFQRKLLKTDTFEDYIKLHGIERAQGFYDALEMFNKAIGEIDTPQTFKNANGGVRVCPNDGTMLAQKVSHLHQFIQNVFNQAGDSLEEFKPRELLTEETFLSYVDKNGVDQAQGYLDALNDLDEEYKWGGYTAELKEDGSRYHKFGHAAIGRRMKAFIEKKKQFVDQVRQIIATETKALDDDFTESLINPSPSNPLTAEQFPLFIKKRGIEAAKGYFDCVRDITAKLEVISNGNLNPSEESSLYVIGNESDKLFSERSRFWTTATKVLENRLQGQAPS